MDVSNSPDVTDAGMKVLCHPESPLLGLEPQQPISPGHHHSKIGRFRKISAPVLSSAGCMLWFKGIRRHSIVHNNNNRHPHSGSNHRTASSNLPSCGEEESLLNPPSMDENQDVQQPGPDSSSPKQCIRSLVRLDISATSVTPVGIQLILASSPSISILSWWFIYIFRSKVLFFYTSAKKWKIPSSPFFGQHLFHIWHCAHQSTAKISTLLMTKAIFRQLAEI